MNSRETDFKTLMEKYQQELMNLQKQAVPVTQTAVPVKAPAAPVPTADPSPDDAKTPDAVTAPQATLQVRVTAANQAIPIAGAVVTIFGTGNSTPLSVQLTDISGLTEPVTLPATDPALTQQPEENLDLVTYDIHVTDPRYFAVRNSGVPLFGGIATVQPVTLIPLPEFEEPGTTELNFSVPRNNL